jgi:hypothetical protein
MADPLALVHTAQRSLGLRLDGATGHRTLPAWPAVAGTAGSASSQPSISGRPALIQCRA